MSSDKVIVTFIDGRQMTTNPLSMRESAGESFAASTRVPNAPGEAFGLRAWYASFRQPAITHLLVRAEDGFEAVIPASQLEGALFQYAIDGQPLAKGGPLRLYVPDGTSACLNVKSVAAIVFVSDAALGDDASYGHRHMPRRVR
ncbi:hypothetical protein [Cohnella sp. GCM10027633]|uniref:hypothetical protein n=1 Tax=unclassified Cohnella TaxID=2636738 RepID=UPI003638EB59